MGDEGAEEGSSDFMQVFKDISDKYGLNKMQNLNYSGIAKVCQTNKETVELIIKEIVATIAFLVRKGSSISLNLKFGLFSIRNGILSFKQFHNDYEHARGGK